MLESLVVHAGAPKTATTYIQRGLFANRSLLADHGVYLPHAGRLELEPNAVSHHHLAWAILMPDRYRQGPEPWTQLADELATVEAPVAILSSEAFSRVASKRGGAALLVEAARRLCDRLTIVYFVRNQLSLINSLYGQRVKSLRTVQRFDSHLARYGRRRLFDYEALLHPWYADAGLRFAAVPFTGDRDADPLQALLEVAGVSARADALVNETDDVNASLGPIGIEAARLLGAYLRGRFPDFDSEELAAKKLYRVSSARAQANGWCDESYWGWSPEQAARIAEHFAPANDRFARAVWGSHWPIPMPVDRSKSTVNLLDLPPSVVEQIHLYVTSLTRRFADLRAESCPR